MSVTLKQGQTIGIVGWIAFFPPLLWGVWMVDGRADVASIDAVTWALIGDFDPTLVAGLRVIGAGPRVGCLPLVTRLARAADVPRFREAFTAAVSDPAIAAELRLMRIRGFVPKDLADYLPVRALVG